MATLEHNLQIFQKILKMVDNPDAVLILSGSTSLALQGVDINVHDIDIVTDEKGAHLIDDILKEHRSEGTPLAYSGTDKYRSWHGRYALDGCDIDIMGEFQYKLKNGDWSKPNHLHEIHQVEYQGAEFPVLSLTQELQEYENVGRADKAAKIRAALQQDPFRPGLENI